MEFKTITSVLRRWWWLLLLAPVLGGFVGYTFAQDTPPVYESSARLLVGPVSGDVDVIRAASQLTQTYGELIESDLVLGAVEETLPQIAGAEGLEVLAVPETRLLTIQVSAASATDAQQFAATLAQQLEQVAAARLDATQEAGAVRVVDRADVPTEPVAPDVPTVVILFAAAALLLNIALVFLLEHFDDTIRSADDLETDGAVDYLGALRTTARRGVVGNSMVVLDRPESPTAMGYRALAARVELASSVDPVRSVAVVGIRGTPLTAELASNLAFALAERASPAILVDADTQSGLVTEMFDLRQRPGLRQLLEEDFSFNGTSSLPLVLHERQEGVTVLPVGSASQQGGRVLSTTIGELLGLLSSDYRYAVLSVGDMGSADALSWACLVDTVVVAVPAGEAHKRDVRVALEKLNFVRIRTLGTVLLEREPLSARLRNRWRAARERPVTVRPAARSSSTELVDPARR